MTDLLDEVLAIIAAARAVGIHPRSLFRAVSNGKVPSTKRDGITYVRLADVRAWNASRKRPAASEDAEEELSSATNENVSDDDDTPLPLSLPPSPAASVPPPPPPDVADSDTDSVSDSGVDDSPPRTPDDSPPVPPLDGPQYVRLFDLFALGVPPEEVVRQTGIVPKVVESALDEWERLRARTHGRLTTVEDLRQSLMALAFESDERDFALADATARVADAEALTAAALARVAKLEAVVAQLAAALRAQAARLDSWILARLQP
jgi:hypothetical protein